MTWTKFTEEDRNDIPYKGDIAVAEFTKDGKLIEVGRLSKDTNFNYWQFQRYTHWMSWNNYKKVIEKMYPKS